MKAWKYLVLLGGIAGLAGFFLPFITFQSADGRIEGAISSYQIVGGIDDVGEIVEGAKPLIAASPEAQQYVKTFNTALADYRGVLVGCYVPALLLALLGALAGMRRRMGRIAALLALALGGANAAVWALFYQISHESVTNELGTASMGIGLHMLLAAGIAGMLAGLGAVIAPDRGGVE